MCECRVGAGGSLIGLGYKALYMISGVLVIRVELVEYYRESRGGSCITEMAKMGLDMYVLYCRS